MVIAQEDFDNLKREAEYGHGARLRIENTESMRHIDHIKGEVVEWRDRAESERRRVDELERQLYRRDDVVRSLESKLTGHWEQ